MQQPSAQGIASLYRGNPQPLQQVIQKEQQAKPGLPPDLQKMLALQIVTNEKDAATAQSAMQQLKQMSGPTGQMPTVMQSLQQQAQQKMQAQAMQAQRQQQGLQALAQQAPPGAVPANTPQPEAQPEAQGLDQLPAEFGMAGGGLVAFAGGDEVADEEKDPDAQAKADRAALASLWESIKGQSENAGRAIADVATMVPRGLAGAYDTAVVRPMRAAGVNAAYMSPKLTPEGASTESMTPFTDVARAREARAGAAPTPAPTLSPDNQSAAETARLQRQTSLPQTSAPVARPPVPGPRPAAAPGAANVAAPGAGNAPRETMDPMEKALRDSIMATMGRKDEDEYKQGVERFQKTTGLDALYKEMGDRATAREARNAAAQKERTPAWVQGLAGLGGAPVRGGLGMLLAKAGAGAGAAREAYGAEDAKFANEVDQLRDAITKAKMEGNIKAANAGEQALKDLIANKRAAEQSGTSLLNTQEQVRARKQIAADNAASRAQMSQARQDQLNQASDMKKLAAAESAFERDPEVKSLLKSLELAVDENSKAVAYRRMRQIQQDKYRQFGVTMADAAPAPEYKVSSAPTGKVLK